MTANYFYNLAMTALKSSDFIGSNDSNYDYDCTMVQKDPADTYETVLVFENDKLRFVVDLDLFGTEYKVWFIKRMNDKGLVTDYKHID